MNALVSISDIACTEHLMLTVSGLLPLGRSARLPLNQVVAYRVKSVYIVRIVASCTTHAMCRWSLHARLFFWWRVPFALISESREPPQSNAGRPFSYFPRSWRSGQEMDMACRPPKIWCTDGIWRWLLNLWDPAVYEVVEISLRPTQSNPHQILRKTVNSPTTLRMLQIYNKRRRSLVL